ncbi:MAG TPA: hypothetical protein VIA63_06085 [Candidatus Limnocylindria bacterium]|jgi:hypothetical protein
MVRLAWTVYRVLVILFALAVMFVTPVFTSGPNGTSVDPAGGLIDALAIAALTVSAGSFLSERRR